MNFEISKINKKTLVIMQAFPETVIELIEGTCRDYLGSKASNTYSKGVYSLISIDLLYSFARNFKYVSSPLFKEIISSYLSGAYSVSMSDTNDLIDKSFSTLSRFGIELPETDNSSDFLEYLVTEVISSWHLSETSFNLGLGSDVVDRVNQQLNGSTNNSDVQFLSEIDQLLNEKIVSIAKFTNGDSWRVDLMRLHAQHPLPESLILDKSPHGNQWVLELCCYIGKNNEITTKELNNYLSRIIPSLTLVQKEEIYCFLESSNLIITTSSRHNYKKCLLSNSAFELSASYFGSSYLDVIEANELHLLHKNWILALVHNKESEALIEEVIRKAVSLPSVAIWALAERVHSPCLTKFKTEFFDYLKTHSKKSMNPFIRKTCLEVLSKYYSKSLNPEYINAIFESDTSQAVQSSAIKIILSNDH
ncbi:hypothetical protein N9W79_01720 [bacterium]|nr:hypothetical protein [bacterium]